MFHRASRAPSREGIDPRGGKSAASLFRRKTVIYSERSIRHWFNYVQKDNKNYIVCNLHGHWTPNFKGDNPARLEQFRNIKRFLDGKLNDNDVRSSTIRDYVTKKQDGKCSICGIIPFWNSKPIVFIVDHIDGNYENNDPHNIRTICPNCNSQTDTFSGKNNDKVEHIIKRVKSNPKRKWYKQVWYSGRASGCQSEDVSSILACCPIINKIWRWLNETRKYWEWRLNLIKRWFSSSET